MNYQPLPYWVIFLVLLIGSIIGLVFVIFWTGRAIYLIGRAVFETLLELLGFALSSRTIKVLPPRS